MQSKLKICFSCNTEKVIWKQHNGHRYCQRCWNRVKPIKLKPLLKADLSVLSEENKKTIALYEGGHKANKALKKVFCPIPKRSEKRQRQEIAYSALRKAFLNNHPECQARISKNCTFLATECHHRAGRIGDLLCDDALFLACCHECHHHIENNREQAIELGFSELRTNK